MSSYAEHPASPHWRVEFCNAYAKYFSKAKAAEIVGVSLVTIHLEEKRNPEFAEMVAAAKEAKLEELQAAVMKRAVKGVKRVIPYYYKGQQCGERVEYRHSDGLAELMLKSHIPEIYNPAIKIDATIKGDSDQERLHMITKMMQAQIDLGFTKDQALSNLLKLGISESDVRALADDSITLSQQDYNVEDNVDRNVAGSNGNLNNTIDYNESPNDELLIDQEEPEEVYDPEAYISALETAIKLHDERKSNHRDINDDDDDEDIDEDD